MQARVRWALAAVLALATAGAHAEDADGCKDHPLFNRMKGFDLGACEEKAFDEARLPIAPKPDGDPPFKMESVEGHVTILTYSMSEGATPASSLQILRNFTNAAKAAGGTVRAEFNHLDTDLSSLGGGERAATLELNKSGRNVWALVLAGDGAYTLTIAEREAMQQEVTANELLDRINAAGFVAVNINFDTGKATIKPDSNGLLDQIAAALKSAPTLKLEVAGHTDNVGGADANRKLSDDRARSVVAALVTRGIAADRLNAKGYGADKPVADNGTEEGRARNRRVELVKR